MIRIDDVLTTAKGATMKIIDMHTHSTCSDGTSTPAEVVREAHRAGISVLSLTDHDTVSGCREAAKECEKYGIKFIPGVEITGKENKKLHFLGYGFDPDDAELNETLDKLSDARRICAQKICDTLRKIGLDVYFEEVEECVSGSSIGKPHVAEVMIKKGYVSSTKEAFDKYLNLPEIKSIEKMKLSSQETIDLIHRAGGLVVMAHPYQLKMDNDRLHNLIGELVKCGLDGIECYYSRYTEDMMKEYLSYSKEFGLYSTIGSDYHGELRKPGVFIGTGADNSLINLRKIKEFDYRILEKL